MNGGETHLPPGVVNNPRPTTIISVKNNELTKTKVDGTVKNLPQPGVGC